MDFNAALHEEEAGEVTKIDLAKNQLMEFRSAIQAMNAEAQLLDVQDDAGEKKGAEMTAQARTILKRIEERQEEIIREPQQFVKAVQQFTLPWREELKGIVAHIKRKLEQYGDKKELARREAEKRAKEESEKLQKEINERAAAAGVEPVTVVMPVLPDKREPVRTETGTTSYVKQWDFEVTDIAVVPVRYLKADPINRSAVLESIRAGVREIPGLKIFERMRARTRA